MCIRDSVKTGGTCASDEPGEGTPKCVSSSKRASMSKSERESASRRKKAADPGQQSKTGAAKPTYVSTDKPKKKVSEAMNFTNFKTRAMDAAKKAVGKKDAKSKTSYVGQRDAGAIAAKKMRQKDQEKVNFLPVEEKKMVKVKLNPEKKIGVKVTDIGPGGKEVVRKNTMDEGTSYGMYKGSGEPSGAMAVFAKKDKEKKKEVKK